MTAFRPISEAARSWSDDNYNCRMLNVSAVDSATLQMSHRHVIMHHAQLVSVNMWRITTVRRESKKQDTKLLPITSPNINRFSQFFRCQTQL